MQRLFLKNNANNIIGLVNHNRDKIFECKKRERVTCFIKVIYV